MEGNEAQEWREALRDLAARDARGDATEKESRFLRSPETVAEWYAALSSLKQQIEAQFIERKAAALDYQQECFTRGGEGKKDWFAYKADYEVWRGKARRFLISIQDKMREARTLDQQLQQPAERTEREEYIRLLRAVLRRCLDYLNDDKNITYAGVVERDDLVGDIKGVLRDKDDNAYHAGNSPVVGRSQDDVTNQERR